MTRIRRAGSIFAAGLSFGRTVGNLVDLIALWRDRSRQRHALMKLDRRMLSDVGIGRVEAENEARKPFWRP